MIVILDRVGRVWGRNITAAIAQLGERQTEDLKVPGSIPGLGSFAAPVSRFALVPYLVLHGVSTHRC